VAARLPSAAAATATAEEDHGGGKDLIAYSTAATS